MAVLAISLTFSAAEGLEIPPDDPWTVVAHWEQCIVRQLTGFGGIVLQRSPLMFIAAFGVHRAPGAVAATRGRGSAGDPTLGCRDEEIRCERNRGGGQDGSS